jgi:hypothetical protein
VSAERCPRCGALKARDRRDQYVVGFDAGRARGHEEAIRARADLGLPASWPSLLPMLIAFVHPDRNPGRVDEATELTKRLLELRADPRGRGR